MSHTVTLQPSGRTFSVEQDALILNAGLKAGVNLPYGCRMGTCCSCRGKVISGSVDLGNAHPAYLTENQRAEGYALLCQASAETDVVIEIEELPELAMPQISPGIVKRIEFLAPDVALLVVRVPLHLNMRFAAGQYVDLLFSDGVRRSYSIANPPQIDTIIDFEFHVRHMPGGLFTDRLFGGMKTREKVEFEGPLGTFFLREGDQPAIFLASGTGYAPIRSILLDTLPKDPSRSFTLYWGARSRQDLYLHEEAITLAEKYPNFTYIPVLSEPSASDDWTGRTGFVHRAVMADLPDLSGHHVYACGAPAMIDAARADFVRHAALPAESFLSDSFVTRAEAAAAAAPIKLIETVYEDAGRA